MASTIDGPDLSFLPNPPRLKRVRGPCKKFKESTPPPPTLPPAGPSPLRKPPSRVKSPRKKPGSTVQTVAKLRLNPREVYPSYRDALRTGSTSFYKLDDTTFIGQVVDPDGGVFTVSVTSGNVDFTPIAATAWPGRLDSSSYQRWERFCSQVCLPDVPGFCEIQVLCALNPATIRPPDR